MKKGLLKAAFTLLLALAGAGSVLAAYDNINSETEALLAKAHKNDTAAMEQLGDIYAQGSGVEQDKDEAMTWYSLANQLGNERAGNKLWKLEGHAKRKVKRVKKSHQYNTPCTPSLSATISCPTSVSAPPRSVSSAACTAASPMPSVLCTVLAEKFTLWTN